MQKTLENNPLLSVCFIVKDPPDSFFDLVREDLFEAEEIVIVDTGSSTETRDRIALEVVGRTTWPEETTRVGQIVLSSFEWCDDFAAARNYSFGLATGKWRGFLDADDRFPGFDKFLDLVYDLDEKDDPENELNINCISLPYIYNEGTTDQPSKLRFVRWEDGWTWADEIHENLQRVVAPGTPGPRGFGGRRHCSETGLAVTHTRTDMREALVRNSRIAKKARQAALQAGDYEKAARMGYYVAQECLERDPQTAYALLEETARVFPGLVFETLALSTMASHAAERGAWDQALGYAGRLTGTQPSNAYSWMLAGTLHARKASAAMRQNNLLWGAGEGPIGDWQKALRCFEAAATAPAEELQTYRDVWFVDGYAPLWHARTLLELGRTGNAVQLLEAIPEAAKRHPNVRPLFVEAQQKIMQLVGLERIKQMAEYYLWDTQPMLALDLIRKAPAAIAEDPRLRVLRTRIFEKLKFLDSWESYQAAYASIPETDYHTAEEHQEHTLLLHRAQMAVAWAEREADGVSELKVLAIGAQDGHIEEAMMNANPRIQLTFVDVAPQASKGFQRLKERFGDRVRGHAIEHDHYDWHPLAEAGTYDCVIMFEVLEHLPNHQTALGKLARALRKSGTLLLSVPSARRWVEPYLTGPNGPDWYGHVRAFNGTTFAKQLRMYNFDGTVYEGYDGTLVAAMEAHCPLERGKRRDEVGIYVPGTPKPFGPFSHLEGFCGGSEECVIHLAAEMGKTANVTVYTPDHVREDGSRVLYHHGVFWQPSENFYAHDERFDTVFFWRCPDVLLGAVKDAPYRKVLWLHDAFYGAPAAAYDVADDVVVLSPSHRKSLADVDDMTKEPQVLANGFDPEDFSEPQHWPERDLNKVVFASSPDRGLLPLLEMWPTVREHNPEATLDIYYDWSGVRARRPELFDVLTAKVGELAEMGVVHKGGVDHKTLHAALLRASVLAYPLTDPHVETFCITAVKAAAAGCIPIVTDTGALPYVLRDTPAVVREDHESVQTPEGQQRFARFVLAHLGHALPADRESLHHTMVERFAWTNVAQDFLELV